MNRPLLAARLASIGCAEGAQIEEKAMPLALASRVSPALHFGFQIDRQVDGGAKR
jgi:hypothetical protein